MFVSVNKLEEQSLQGPGTLWSSHEDGIQTVIRSRLYLNLLTYVKIIDTSLS